MRQEFPIVASFIVFSTIAICLPDKIEGRAMRVTLGIVLIILSLYFSFFKSRIQKFIRPTRGWQLGTGVIAGNWAYKHIPNRLFTYIVYIYIGISGLIILLTA